MLPKYSYRLIVLPALLFVCRLYAGEVTGLVTDESGSPLPFAAIYVQESGTGTTTNADGYYQLRLSPGAYTLVYQYLGYKTEVRSLRVGSGNMRQDVQLNPQPLDLGTVEVYEGREDPAYTIMRKAIAKATYHRQQIETYTAQVYIKGSGRIKDTPFFLRKAIEKEGIDSTVAFTSESVSEISYQRPNIFKEKVISVYSQGEDNGSSPNGYINSSFYQTEVVETISPLSPKAFAYYKFEFEGSYMDRGYEVNKIKVIPRSRGEGVFEGTIYIVEDWWSIHSLDLMTFKLGFTFRLKQVYAPVDDKAWLPVTHRIEVEGGILGINFEYNYLATVSNYNITLNPDLPQEFEVVDENTDQKALTELEQKRRQNAQTAEIQEKLSSGQTVTRKELRKMMKEYEKQEVQEQKEPEVVEQVEFTVDSMASKRDSLYWADIRPVPLTTYELKGYHRSDSIAKVETTQTSEGGDGSIEIGVSNKRKKNHKFGLTDLVVGNSYPLSKGHRLIYESQWDKVQFNPVEGFHLYNNLRYRGNLSKKDQLEATFTPRYAFARNAFSGKGALEWSKKLEHGRRSLSLEGGRYIYQYNERKPLSELVNTYLNLFAETNYIRLYEKDYLRQQWTQPLGERWRWTQQLEWAKRYTLMNNTSQTWFPKADRGYASNIPVNEEIIIGPGSTQTAVFGSVRIEGEPWQKYKIRNGNKEAIDHSSPTVSLSYTHGFPNIGNSTVNFDRLDAGIQHKWRWGARGIIDAKLEAGVFLNNKNVGFQDFRHFTGNRTGLVTVDPVGSFRLLDYYRFSTQDKYLNAHLHYQFKKLLVTQIPQVWMLGMKENVFVNYLTTPQAGHYVEMGYSIDNIFRFLRVETAVSFRNGRYLDWGILLGVASNIGNFNIN